MVLFQKLGYGSTCSENSETSYFFIMYLIVFEEGYSLSCLCFKTNIPSSLPPKKVKQNNNNKPKCTSNEPGEFCGERKLMLSVLLENENDGFFPSKRSPILIKKRVNIAGVPLSNELNLFLWYVQCIFFIQVL